MTDVFLNPQDTIILIDDDEWIRTLAERYFIKIIQPEHPLHLLTAHDYAEMFIKEYWLGYKPESLSDFNHVWNAMAHRILGAILDIGVRSTVLQEIPVDIVSLNHRSFSQRLYELQVPLMLEGRNIANRIFFSGYEQLSVDKSINEYAVMKGPWEALQRVFWLAIHPIDLRM